MTHNMTPRRALRIVHFVRAALSLDPRADRAWLQLAADAERWALASLAGSRTKALVRVSGVDGLAVMKLGALARQVRALCGFIA